MSCGEQFVQAIVTFKRSLLLEPLRIGYASPHVENSIQRFFASTTDRDDFMASSLSDASSDTEPSDSEFVIIRRWLKWLTVGMFLVAMALLFVVSAVFGAIVDFHAGEGILIAGASCGGAIVGFLLGWLARRAL